MSFGSSSVRTLLGFLLVLLSNLEGRWLLTAAAAQVPCFFIFGDSLVDNGNNNNLNTTVKVNYQPYGIDFPQGPTGRFTNGRNEADFIASHLGFKNLIPPYASAPDDREILMGVNYASGSSGIRDETGQQLGDRIFLDKQLGHHNTTVTRITKLLGNRTAARQHLGKCLYYFNVGSNDYINNYFLPENYNTSSLFNPEQYAAVLIEQFSNQLKELHHLGSRKVAVTALHALGCIPAMTSRSPKGVACNESMNDAVRLFNSKLRLLVRELNDEYTDKGAKYVVINEDAVNPPGKLLTTPCCKVSESTGLCMPGKEAACAARNLHIFFDNFHPTEIFNKLLGALAYKKIATLIQE